MKFLLLVLLFLLSTTYAQSTKQRIAVLELDADGVSQNESVTLTDRLRSELFKTGSFVIIERGEMDEILKEQGFQMSGCTSNECAVTAGRLLNVNQIAAGSIGKVGAVYTVSVRLIDVQTGEILKTATEDCQCPVERVLTNSMRNAALKLAGRMSSSGTTLLSEGNGDIFVKTEPDGADIYLDNIKTEKISPVTLQDVAAGIHLIKAIKGKYIATKSVTVKANAIVTETIRLEKARGGLKIYSNPPEADIFIDGQSFDRTPKIIKQLSVGNHQLVVKKETYEDYSKTIKVNFNKFLKVNVTLEKLSGINIKSNPTNADVAINGKSYGGTPLTVKLASGRNIRIKITKNQYADWQKTITLKEGQNQRIDARLVKLKGSIFLANMSRAAKLTINGIKIKAPNQDISLPVGKYKFELSKAGYVDKSFSVELTAGKKKSVNALLEKKTTSAAVLRSFAMPGWGQAYQEKAGRSWIYAIAYLGSGIGSFLYTNKYNTAISDYAGVKTDYSKAVDASEINRLRTEMHLKYDEINSAENSRNIFYVATGAIWLINMLDVMILPPGWTRDISLSVNNDAIKAGIVLNF